jgi:peptidyl-prolyl cis-trans isomerase C
MFQKSVAAFAVALLLAGAAQAQNVAIVNGKAVPKSRVDTIVERFKAQAAQQGRPIPPELEERAREQVVISEIFAQEAERRGMQGSSEYRAQLEVARQQILIQSLFDDFRKKNPVTDAEAKAEYDKFKAQAAGTEYRARHILVEKEDEAKALIVQIKGGAKFDDLAKKHSKDPAPARTAATSTSPSPTATCPSSARP